MKNILPHWEEESGTVLETEKEHNPVLLLINDDVNNIEFVVECLMKYCNHTMEQATQCAFIVHHNGKTDIMHGTYEKLRPVFEALLDCHLRVKIEI